MKATIRKTLKEIDGSIQALLSVPDRMTVLLTRSLQLKFEKLKKQLEGDDK